MANEISITEIDEFLASPIVTWFASCLGASVKDQLTYEELVDGVLIYDVFLQMDIDGQSNDVSPSHNNPIKHLANLETVMRHIRQFYEDHLGEIILYPPHVHLIVQEPRSNVREVELLLVLLLGCAVKCRNNEYFVEKITLLDENTQAIIASYISKVLHFPDIVLSKQMLSLESIEDEQQLSYHKQKVNKAFKEIRRINKERNELLVQLRSSSLSHNDMQNCVKELNEWKAEAFALNDQLDDYKRKIASIESENKRLAAEAKSCRDALEDMSEKVQQNERLDQEVVCYREKLKKMSFYKVRYDELEQNNRSLREKRDELNGQLKAYKAMTDKKMREMEMEIVRLQQRCNELAIENEASCEQNSKLYEENADLERRIKLSTSMNVTLDSSFSAEADESFNSYNNSSICEQLSQSAQSHALKFELESRRLETLQENSFLESSLQILDLEKEKKRLEHVIEELNAKVSHLEDNLTSVNRDKMQLRVLLENAQRCGSSELELRVATLESEKKRDEKIIEELQMKLHEDSEDDSGDDLNTSILKSPAKHKVKYDQLYSDYQSVLQERNSLEKKLREAKLKMMQHSEATLPDEHANLKQDFSLLMSEYRNEKSKADELARRHKDYEKELRARNLKIFEFDNQIKKLRNQCEVLTELNNRLESDKKMMNKYMSQMLKQNRQLVVKSLERQQKFYDEDKKKNETLNNLTRAKTKLEEKVMSHYRNMDNRRESKKRSAAVSAVKNTFVKVRRAGSEFFGVSRWSSADDTDFGCSKTLDNTTKASGFKYVATPRNRKSIDFLENFKPENFSFDDKENES